MSRFDGQNLFDSGPHRFRIGGLTLRHVLHETPAAGARGVQLSAHGQSGRAIEQHGDLLADDPQSMTALVTAIEGKLDGLAHDLVDEHGRAWHDTVMLSFDPQPMTRAGTRWRTSYRIQYLQVKP